MWLFSLKMALRPSKRLLLTILGISICVMYVSGTYALVGGLREGREYLVDDNELFYLCSKDGPLENSIFSASEQQDRGDSEVFWGVISPVSFANISTYILGFSDPLFLIAGNPELEYYNGVLVGPALVDAITNATFTVSSPSGSVELLTEGFFESSLIPPDWIVADPHLVRDIAGMTNGVFSFFITNNISSIDTDGISIQPLASKQGFYMGGVGQVEKDLWILSSIAGVISIIVVYTLMQVEILARRSDINILKGIGGRKGWIVGVFTLEASVASFAGGALGIIFGIIGANIILSAFTLAGYTVLISANVTWASTIIPLCVSLLSGTLGGIMASIRGVNLSLGASTN